MGSTPVEGKVNGEGEVHDEGEVDVEGEREGKVLVVPKV